MSGQPNVSEEEVSSPEHGGKTSTLAEDAIERSKRILALVDAYAERPTQATRTTLRVALVEEFAQARTLGRGDFSDEEWQLMQQALANYVETKKTGKVRARMATLWQRLRERV